jgi:hypothetical protein
LTDDQPVKLKEGGPFLSKADCVAAGEKAKSFFDQESGQLDIDNHKYLITNDIMLVKMVYTWLLNKKLKELKLKQNCQGCSEDQPGQAAHIDGCLEEWTDFVSLNVDDIDETINPLHLTDLYIEVLKYLKVSIPSTVCAMAQCVKAYITEQHEDLIYYAEDGDWYSDILNTIFTQCLLNLEEKQNAGS